MVHKRISLAIALVGSLILGGCASGYSEFYKPAQGVTPEQIAQYRAGPPSAPEVQRGVNPGTEQGSKALLDAYARRGYALIGTAFFNSGRQEGESGAIAQAQKVGADLVLLFSPKYTGSINSAIPITTPTTTTSYTNSTATAYGPGGVVNAYGSGTTTTYGSTTTMVPFTVHRQDFGALFFIKRKWAFGALWRELSDAERQSLGTNKGVVASVIVDDSPAYAADILPGDIIVSIDDEPVRNGQSASQLLQSKAGRLVRVGVVRNSRPLVKEVQLGR